MLGSSTVALSLGSIHSFTVQQTLIKGLEIDRITEEGWQPNDKNSTVSIRLSLGKERVSSDGMQGPRSLPWDQKCKR